MKQVVKIAEKKEPILSETALVEPSQVPLVWGQVEKWLEKGGKWLRDYYRNEHLYNAVMNGQMQLWVAYRQNRIRTIMLTQLDVFPECIQFRYVYMGGTPGSFKEILHDYKKVETWAIAHGATKACIIGRDGWIKAMAKYGWRKRSVMLTKDLVTPLNGNRHEAWRQ